MMIRQYCCLLLLLLTINNANAAVYVFDNNARCQQAYQAYLSLRIADGDDLIRKETAANPQNLMAAYLSDYGDFLYLLFKGNPEEFKRRQTYFSRRLDLLDHAADDDPWKGFCRSGIYLRWAVLHGWYGEQFKAATTFRKSYLILKENSKRFPDFAQNNIFLGVQEAVAGSIPDEYKWLASVFGMKGDVRRGVSRLSAFLDAHPGAHEPLRNEAVIYYLYIRFYLLSQQDAVWDMLNSSAFSAKGNLLHSFVKVNLALNYHRADIALQTLKDAAGLPGFAQIPALDYEMGNALYLRLDHDCMTWFSRFISNNRNKAYIKDAWMKCALAAYLQGDIAKATAFRARIGTEGNLNTDADKQAQRFFKEGSWPDVLLLQVRLLTDGGYYTTAIAKLQTVDVAALNITDALEYLYRSGKAFESTGDVNKAAGFYQRAINTGRDRREQYAARAALQLALIYERSQQVNEALRYFRLCLTMKQHDFQSSIDQQAKAGINRLTANP